MAPSEIRPRAPSDTRSFVLRDWDPVVPVTLPKGMTSHDLLNFKAFNDWISALKSSLDKQIKGDHTFSADPYKLKSITVDACDKVGEKLLFVKLVALIENGKGERLPGVAFLRGGSVAILMILRPLDASDERYVVMTEQPRPAAGILRFVEIPAGMLDEHDNFVGQAVKEVEEEVGLKLNKEELIDMTELALKDHFVEENFRSAMYPSPGACDEFIKIFLWEQERERMEIEDLRDRLTGKRAEMEKIKVKLMPYEKLLQVGTRDGKTLAAWSLYEYLKRTRLLPEHLGHHV